MNFQLKNSFPVISRDVFSEHVNYLLILWFWWRQSCLFVSMALWVMPRGISGALQISVGVDASKGHLIHSFQGMIPHTREAQSRKHRSGTFCRKQENRCSFLLYLLSSREILAGDDWWVITCLILPYRARLYYRVLQIVNSFKEQVNSPCLPTEQRVAWRWWVCALASGCWVPIPALWVSLMDNCVSCWIYLYSSFNYKMYIIIEFFQWELNDPIHLECLERYLALS